MDENTRVLADTLIRCTRALVHSMQCMVDQENPPYFRYPNEYLNEAAELIGSTGRSDSVTQGAERD